MKLGLGGRSEPDENVFVLEVLEQELPVGVLLQSLEFEELPVSLLYLEVPKLEVQELDRSTEPLPRGEEQNLNTGVLDLRVRTTTGIGSWVGVDSTVSEG